MGKLPREQSRLQNLFRLDSRMVAKFQHTVHSLSVNSRNRLLEKH